MKIQLSQKEKVFLEDAKIQEEVCIQKYKNYANNALDPQLKHLFNKHAGQEQQHHDSISLLLQGKQPNLGQGEQSNSSQQQQQSTSNQRHQSQQTSIENNFEGTMNNESDKVLCLDLLSTEKYISGTYNSDIFECVNSEVRQVLQHIQKEEQTHGEELFNYMNSHGMYNVQ